jgi:hypothetical protein
MRHSKKALALAALALLQLSDAAIIKVYDPRGGRDYEAMARAAETLRERYLTDSGEPEGKGLAGGIDGFGYRIVPGSLVTPDLSMAPGSSAFFWSSTSYKYQPGFSFKGGTTVFQSASAKAGGGEALGKKAPGSAPAYATALNSASIAGGSLTLRYSLEKPALVSLRVTSVSGKSVGKWSWREGSAGVHARSVDARLSQGVYLVSWSSGGVRRTTRIRYDGSR